MERDTRTVRLGLTGEGELVYCREAESQVHRRQRLPCSSIREVEVQDGFLQVPAGVRAIGREAFSFCGLRRIALPPGVERIGREAFAFCSALESVTLPRGLRELGREAFRGCGSLTALTLPEGVRVLSRGTFQVCTALKTVLLPDSLVEIGAEAFWGCEALEELDLPPGVRYMGDSAFEQFLGLEHISLPQGLEELGSFAFAGCPRLRELTIPSTVEDMGDWEGRGALRRVTVPGRRVLHWAEVFSGWDVELCLPDVLPGELPEPVRIPALRGFLARPHLFPQPRLTPWLEALAMPDAFLALGDCPQVRRLLLEEGRLTLPQARTLVEESARRGMPEMTASLLQYIHTRFSPEPDLLPPEDL